jgi:peptidoglycan/xylan/chitin deacetylase (PgdA/CDA1 family)
MLGRFRDSLDAGRGFLGGVLRGSTRHRGIRVFRYHGVIEKQIDPLLERNQHLLEVFRAQMSYLRKFRVFGLDELLERFEKPNRPWPSAAVVTFDDGFANNRMVADVMHRLRLPWCLFVPVGEIGEQRAMWLDELSLLLVAGDAPKIEVQGTSWSLRNRQEREQAFRQLRPRLKMLSCTETRRTMAEIRAQYPAGECERLIAKFPGLRMLSWKELGELASMGVAIGSHGVYHGMHHAEQPREERLRELSVSRQTLESKLGRPCRAFAFPNGDYVSDSPKEAEDAGYAVAFTTDARAIGPEDSRYLLPRLGAPQSLRRFVSRHWFQDPPTKGQLLVTPASAES